METAEGRQAFHGKFLLDQKKGMTFYENTVDTYILFMNNS